MRKPEKRLKSEKKVAAKIKATWWFGVIATFIQCFTVGQVCSERLRDICLRVILSATLWRRSCSLLITAEMTEAQRG